MKHSPSWEANSSSASQKIPHILWDPKVHYRIYNSPPPVSNISQINPVHGSHYTSWSSILILPFHLRLGLRSGLFPSGFPTKTLYVPLLSSLRATRPANLILFDFITRKIFGEEYRSQSSSLRSLHSFVTSYLLGTNIFFSALFSNIHSLFSSLSVRDQISHPYKTHKNN